MPRRAFLVLALLSACSHREESPPPAPKTAAVRTKSPVLDRLRSLPLRIDSGARLVRVGSGYALAGLTTDHAGFSRLGADRFAATVPAKTTDAVHLGVREGGKESFALDVFAEDVSAGVAKEGTVEGGGVVFAEAVAGIDVVHLVEAGRVEELRVVRVPQPSVTMRHRLVLGRGIAELRLREGRVEALDRDGIVRIASEKEIAWDANGAVLPVAVALKKEGEQYVLESRVATDAHPFPVTIDPSWAPTVDIMTTSRAPAWPFALPGNKVLVLGGSKYTDVFDPYAGIEGKWSTTPPAPLVGWSNEASAIQLLDGKILTVGVSDGVAGIPAPNYPYLSYLYDPATGTSTRVGDMPYRHGSPTLTLLGDGRVVAFGAANGSSYFNASVDVYDPASKSWTHGVTLASSLHGFVQAKLPSGRVLIAGGAPYGGGAVSTALIYDATANTTAPTGSLSAPRTDAAVVTLADGKIMALGGYVSGGYTGSAEVFDESTGTWTLLTNKMAYARYGHAVTKLTDGRYLITGGQGFLGTSGSAATLSTAEYYDPVAKTFAAAPSMGTKRTNHAAFLIPNGRVLVAGGSADFVSGYNSSEIYTPDPVASTDPTACASGFAADGYCCDRACTGTCEACNLPGKIGVCSPVTGAPATGHASCAPYLCAGADATGKGVCGKSCGTDAGCTAGNYCDATSSACAPLKTSGSGCGRDGECTGGHCVDGVCCNTSCAGTCNACDVAPSIGTCTALASGDPRAAHGSCGAYACKAGACVTGSCAADTDCASKDYCDSTTNTCVSSLGKGAICKRDSQCLTGHCVDGYCCDTACNGACQACDVTPGTCVGVTGGPHGTRSCAPFAKCSSGLCITSCGGDADCLTGVCDPKTLTCVATLDAGADTSAADTGVADTSVADTAVADTSVADSSVADTTVEDTFVADTSVADTSIADTTVSPDMGAETPIADMPAPAFPAHPTIGEFQRCTKSSECASGFCVEGVCCDSACNDRCHSCVLLSNPGKCTLEPIGVDMKNECGPSNQCLGTCGGTGECIGSGNGTMCSRNRCTGTSTGIGPAYCPGPGGKCATDDAVPFECAPYACDPVFGACLAQCTSSDQCAAGNVCDVTSKTCVAAPSADNAATNGDGGSGGCTVSHSNKRSGSLGLIAMVLALAASRRRRA